MSYHKNGLIFCQFSDRLLKFSLIFRVYTCSCFIQNNDRRVFQDRTGNRNSLSFST